jgi:hypothetical protein
VFWAYTLLKMRRYRHAEVGNFGVEIVVNQNVSRLDVAMYDAFLERITECHGALVKDIGEGSYTEQLRWTNVVIQGCAAINIFHDDAVSVLVDTGIENRHYVGVFQHPGRLGFVKKHVSVERSFLGLVDILFGSDFYRGGAINKGILAKVNGCHIAFTNLFKDLVFP